jgi:hypothetical protein
MGLWIFDFGFSILDSPAAGFSFWAATPNPKSKSVLALLLFVARVLADDAHHVLALDDLAAFAKPFDGCSDFHVFGWFLFFSVSDTAFG